MTAGSDCAELEAGETMLVHQSFDESPTGLSRLYSIEKDVNDGNVFHIGIPIRFSITDPAVSANIVGSHFLSHLSPNDILEYSAGLDEIAPAVLKILRNSETAAAFVASQEASASMFVRANQCLLTSHGRIVGIDGTDLRLYARTHSQVGVENAIENTIEVSLSPHRSTSDNWADDVDCDVIIHEVLHLLGLVDGYEEHDYDYQCRHLETNNSLMSSISVLGPFFDFMACSDHGSNEDLINIGTDTKLSCENPGKFGTGSRLDVRRLHELTGDTVVFSERSIAPSLQRAHINFITRPFCQSINEQYIRCSENAYRSSAEGCIETPDYCADGSYLEN